MKSILQIKDLTVCFQQNKKEIMAVKDVSLSLNEKEILGLVGESGSGKTTTALSILRLIELPGYIKKGSIIYNDIDLLSLSEKELNCIRGKKIAMIFQEPSSSLDPLFTIGNQLTETIQHHMKFSHKEAKQAALLWLSKVGFKEPAKIYNCYPFELSGGMQQRAMIAIALCCNPTILLADEPTSSLDVISQAQIIDLLIKMKEELALSILLISHNFGLIAQCADKIAIMYQGMIIEEGAPVDIFNKPFHTYTKKLIASLHW